MSIRSLFLVFLETPPSVVDPAGWIKGVVTGLTVAVIMLVLNRFFQRRDKASEAEKAAEKGRDDDLKALKVKAEECSTRNTSMVGLFEKLAGEFKQMEELLNKTTERSQRTEIRHDELQKSLERVEALVMKVMENVLRDH